MSVRRNNTIEEYMDNRQTVKIKGVIKFSAIKKLLKKLSKKR